jgi:uncharacterized protein YdhG (YjbR/CyaY superfamily)
VSKPTTVTEYIENIPENRLAAFKKLRKTIKANIPKGFKEGMSYGMPGYVVPLSTYPDGYHCKKDTPLPFASLANQKNFIAVYHMGMYVQTEIKDWFEKEYAERCKYKLDMGKSCIRLKKMEDIPYDLIGELFQKMSMREWIDIYEDRLLKK